MFVNENADLYRHLTFASVGGFFGAYAILCRSGILASAQTMNLLEMVMDALHGKGGSALLHLLCLVIYFVGTMSTVLLPHLFHVDMRRLCPAVDALAAVAVGFFPEEMPVIVALYPVFFAMSVQWSTFAGARGFNSSTIFSTNNTKQASLALAEYMCTKNKDQLLRMAAEYENYRKRSTREADQKFNDGVSFAVNQIIPILDTLEMAANAPTTDENYKKGVTMTLDKAAKALEALHVEEIEALGKPFDPNFMNAVQQIPAPDGQESGTVVTVYQKGYKLGDKIGTIYIVFSLAVPSLAYIFMVKALGRLIGMPTTFDIDKGTWLMYVLPIISLALPSIGNLMKWLRRYMIDQMNSDYVKFARSGGLSESEIFSKHIFKNAAIPIIHGIPGTVLFALVGAIITERVYVVPGAGNLLTTAINMYDNNVIVGLTLFYALLSVVAIILGDLLMTLVDPRISFVQKAR